MGAGGARCAETCFPRESRFACFVVAASIGWLTRGVRHVGPSGASASARLVRHGAVGSLRRVGSWCAWSFGKHVSAPRPCRLQAAEAHAKTRSLRSGESGKEACVLAVVRLPPIHHEAQRASFGVGLHPLQTSSPRSGPMSCAAPSAPAARRDEASPHAGVGHPMRRRRPQRGRHAGHPTSATRWAPLPRSKQSATAAQDMGPRSVPQRLHPPIRPTPKRASEASRQPARAAAIRCAKKAQPKPTSSPNRWHQFAIPKLPTKPSANQIIMNCIVEVDSP
jgi:hypothetical protein